MKRILHEMKHVCSLVPDYIAQFDTMHILIRLRDSGKKC